MPKSFLAAAAAALLPLAAVPAPAAPPFTLQSSDFTDGAMLARRHAGAIPGNANCVGENVSPALRWSNVPAGTRSIVLMVVDPEGRSGAGVVHWLAYGIKPELGGFATGAASNDGPSYVGGKSTMNVGHYSGPCTPPDVTPHHYTFLALATDLAPDALAPGLTREEVLPQLNGHVKGASGIIGRFVHP